MSETPGGNPQSYADAIVHVLREPLLVLDEGLCVKAASPSFYAMFKSTAEETLGRPLGELGDGQWNTMRLRTLLEELLSKGRCI